MKVILVFALMVQFAMAGPFYETFEFDLKDMSASDYRKFRQVLRDDHEDTFDDMKVGHWLREQLGFGDDHRKTPILGIDKKWNRSALIALVGVNNKIRQTDEEMTAFKAECDALGKKADDDFQRQVIQDVYAIVRGKNEKLAKPETK